jgi:hypothetical protein
MGAGAAFDYHSLFANVERFISKGIPLHPESLLEEQLSGLSPKSNLSVYFAPLRLPDAKHESPWLDQLQISPVDMAEYLVNAK